MWPFFVRGGSRKYFNFHSGVEHGFLSFVPNGRGALCFRSTTFSKLLPNRPLPYLFKSSFKTLFKTSLFLSTITKLKMAHKESEKKRLMDRALFDLGPQLARFGHLTIIERG